MKTTIDIPDPVFRRAKSIAAAKGVSFRRYVTGALEEQLAKEGLEGSPRPWMKSFGKLTSLHDENQRIERIIEAEFGTVDPDGGK